MDVLNMPPINKKTKLVFQLSVVVLFLAAAFALAQEISDSDQALAFVQQYGYLGIFLLAIFGGFNIIVPIPAITFLPVFLTAGLNQWLVFLVIAVGATLADTIAFMIGRIGREVAPKERDWIKKVQSWRDKHYLLPLAILLIFATVVPLPNEVLLIPLGFIGYRFKWILPVVFVGNFLFNMIAGLGVINLFELLSLR